MWISEFEDKKTANNEGRLYSQTRLQRVIFDRLGQACQIAGPIACLWLSVIFQIFKYLKVHN